MERKLKGFHCPTLVVHLAVRIVSLNCEGTLGEMAPSKVRGRPAFRLGVFDGRFAIHLDFNFATFDNDMVVEPLAIGAWSFLTLDMLSPLWRILALGQHENVDYSVKAAGLLRILVGRIHLALIAFAGPAFVLVFRVEIDTAVGLRERLGANLELKILKFPTVNHPSVEKVTAAAFHDELAILYRIGIRIFFGRSPAFEALAVKKLNESVLGLDRSDNQGAQRQN